MVRLDCNTSMKFARAHLGCVRCGTMRAVAPTFSIYHCTYSSDTIALDSLINHDVFMCVCVCFPLVYIVKTIMTSCFESRGIIFFVHASIACDFVRLSVVDGLDNFLIPRCSTSAVLDICTSTTQYVYPIFYATFLKITFSVDRVRVSADWVSPLHFRYFFLS